MLEIDNRYPEYARPYEPIKGRRRHGRLTGNESAFMAQRRMRRLDMTRRGFLTGVGILIVLTVLMPEAKKELILPKVEPVVIEIEKPTPEPEVIPEIKDPEELPIVIPEPKPTPPEPKPTPPKPKPKPKPEKEKKAPVIDLDPSVQGPDPEMIEYPMLFFDMKLNDLKGGSAKGRVYVDTGSGFHEPALNASNNVVVTYDPASVSGDVWSDSISCYIQEPEGGGIKGIKGRAKIVFDIVYPDGKKARIESETRPVHKGTFWKGYSWLSTTETDTGTGTVKYKMIVDVIIDKSLVDPSKVEMKEGINNVLYVKDASDYWLGGAAERYVDGSGQYHIIYTYSSDTPFPNGTYGFEPELEYKEDDYNSWEPFHCDYYFEKTS